MKRVLSSLFIIIGTLMFLYGFLLLWQRYNPWRLSFNRKEIYTSSLHTQNAKLPFRLTIPALQVHLPILTSSIINNQWETTENGVSYLSSSPLPGTTGNSILYGHNWSSILGNLNKIRIGDVITVEYPNGTGKSFEVAYIYIVTADETHIIGPTNDTRITIFTCTGFLDSKRLVVTALLKKDPLAFQPRLH